jgi:hypothetical protein
MAKASAVQWDGLAELLAALRQLPNDLRDEGRRIVSEAAEAARQATIANYPEGPTGNLRKGVVVKEQPSDYGMIALLFSRAPHAHLYEYGTARGMPPAPHPNRLGTHAGRERRKMYQELRALLESHGLEVSGDV